MQLTAPGEVENIGQDTQSDRTRVHDIDAAALRLSEARHGAIVSALQQVMWRADARGRCLEASGWEDLTGESFLTLADGSFLTNGVLHPEDASTIRARSADGLQDLVSIIGEFRLRTRSRGYRWYKSHGIPLRGSDGEIREWIGLMADIHEQRINELSLLKAAERQRLIAETQASVSLLGLSPQEILSHVADRLLAALGADSSAVALPYGGELEYRVFAGARPAQPLRIHIDASLSGWCYRNGKAVKCDDAADDPRTSMLGNKAFGTRSLVMAPITVSSRTVGVLFAGKAAPNAFVHDDLHTAEVFAGIAGAALANAAAFQEKKILLAERTEAVAQLRDSEALFRALTEHSDELVNIVNQDGTIRYSSPSLARILGYDREEIIGRRPSDIVHPDDRERMLSTFAELLSNPGASRQMTVRLRHKNGSYRNIEGTGRNLLHVPAVKGITSNARDVTDRVVAMQSMEFQSKLLQTVEQAVIATDLDGCVTYWGRHAERMYGWSESEALGQSITAMIASPSMERRAEDILAQLLTGRSWAGECEVKRRDGSTFQAMFTNTPFHDQKGNVIGIVGVSTDITAQRVLEVQLRQAQKMDAVGQLAGGIAHDFNNILTAITGYSELLLEGIPEGAVRDDVLEIREAARRASDLTKQLLVFSRKQVMKVVTLDLADVLSGMERMLRRMINESITLQTSLPDFPVLVDADTSQLEQVIMNLVVNARDAMADGGRLKLTLEVAADNEGPGNTAVLRVMDEGCGMDESIRTRIFEPFFTTKPEGHGTGLGLSVVYGIVQQLNGSIEVLSQVGHGSTFVISLPLAAGVNNERNDERREPRGGTETILLVEDSEPLAVIASRVLARLGYRVIQAANGAEARRLADAGMPRVDLVLTDVVMPGLNGPALVAELAKRGMQPAVLYMSGYTQNADLSGVLERAEASFLAKPWTPRALALAVRSSLDALKKVA